jgi:hypothetical protein
VADATSLTVVKVSLKKSIITPSYSGIRTEKVAEAAANTHLLVPQGD